MSHSHPQMPHGVSVVIPTHDREDILGRTLESLFDSKLEDTLLEVIVVNDGAPFKSKISNIEKCSILSSSEKGAASARNMGARSARYSILLFLDDDMIVAKDNIQRHLELQNRLDKTAVSGIWHYHPDIEASLSGSCFGRYKLKNDYKTFIPDELHDNSPLLRRSPSLASFNLSIKKSDFKLAGGFDEAFKFAGCEDQEFSIRLRNRGITLLVATDIISFHNERDRLVLDNWLNRQFSGSQGLPVLVARYPANRADAGAMSPAYRLFNESSPITRADSMGLILRKICKVIFYNRLIAALLKTAYHALDYFDRCERLRHSLITRMGGIYIYRGFREGCESLASGRQR